MPPCRRAGAALPGRFAETLDSCPHRTTGFFFHSCPAQDNWKLFFKVVGLDGNLEQGGAQVGHGGVALALAREFEVYDMVVHSGGAIDLRI